MFNAATLNLPADPPLSGTPVIMADRVEIFPSTPLPHLNQPHARAYAARMRGESKSSSYALVCDDRLPVRSETFSAFLGCDNINLIRFRDQGVVDWPLSGRREAAVILNRPSGPALSAFYASSEQKPLDDAELVSFFIRPITSLLTDMIGRGISHGNIHPGNIFVNAATHEAQLGEALSGPPSSAQPVLFCTIERGQCQPTGRGIPAAADDIYAMGVTGLILALGRNPWAGMSDEEILRLKLEKGSFIGLVGDIRLKGSTVELFRSMLDDNPRARWSLSDLQMWLSGRRPPPRTGDEHVRASRPLLIGNQSCDNLRSVVYGLTQEPLQGAGMIENGELEKWIAHSIGNEGLATTLKRAVVGLMAGGRGSTFHDMIVARAAIVLDPQGPIRYRGVCVMPNGIANYLGSTFVKGGNLQVIAELISSKLPAQWVDEQEDGRADHLQTLQQLEYAKAMMDKKHTGFGLERIVYELLPAMPCLTTGIKDYCCRTVRDLMEALNIAAGKGTLRDAGDRHLMGFLFAREKRIPAPYALSLSAADGSPQKAVAVLRVLAEAQHQHGPDDLTALTNWMVSQLEPATRRFFEKAAQDKARQQLKQAATSGKLMTLVEAVDNTGRLERDRDEFERARDQYARAALEIADLQLDAEEKLAVEIKVGRPIASITAALAGFVTIGIVILMTMLGVRF
ncbi:MAG: hypothetical protein AB7G06_04380 [Bdellovibrionales bacterium]